VRVNRRQLGLLGFAVLGIIASAELLYLGRNTTFFYDEWGWIQSRRGWNVAAFLDPHNGHLSILPVAVYHLLFETFGLRAYLPYRLVLMACDLAVALLLYLYCRRRIGPWAALLPTALILFLGAAWQDLLWPFQIGFLGSIGFGVAAVLLIEGQGRRRELGAAACLAGAVACSGIGIPVVIWVAVRIAAERNWRRWWIVAAPTAPYLLWYLIYSDTAPAGNLASVASYFVRAFDAATTGLAGLGIREHPLLSVLLGGGVLVAVAARLVVDFRARRVPAGLLGVLAFGGSFWLLTALTRAQFHDFDASRYLYPGGVAIVLMLTEVARDTRLRRRIAAPIALALIAATAACVVSGQDPLKAGARGLTDVSAQVRVELGALEASNPDPGYRPEHRLMPVVTAGQYLSAVRALGSPALPLRRVPGLRALLRNIVDRILLDTHSIRSAVPAADFRPSPTAEPLRRVTGATVRSGDGCALVIPKSGQVAVRADFELPESGVVVKTTDPTLSILAYRFGTGPRPFMKLPSHTDALLTGTSDGVSTPWHISVLGSSEFSICGVS
jgi:hypothetical protein